MSNRVQGGRRRGPAKSAEPDKSAEITTSAESEEPDVPETDEPAAAATQADVTETDEPEDVATEPVTETDADEPDALTEVDEPEAEVEEPDAAADATEVDQPEADATEVDEPVAESVELDTAEPDTEADSTDEAGSEPESEPETSHAPAKRVRSAKTTVKSTATKTAAPAKKAAPTKKTAAPAKKAAPAKTTTRPAKAKASGRATTTEDQPLTKPEKRALAKKAAAKRAAAQRRKKIGTWWLSGVLVIGVILAVFFGCINRKSTTPSASASASANASTAASFPPLPEGADPALAKKPTVEKPTGDVKELKVTTLIEGKGPATTNGQHIVVNYVGVAYKTGEEFDSSWKRSQAFDFDLGGQVIQGWNQGLVGVKVGSRVQLDIPSALAYGDSGQVPGSLRFVVDVLSAT